MLCDALERRYDAYVDGYRGPDGDLPEMMRLKREHTAQVVRFARMIADGEGFDARTRTAAVAAALLHDTGRYEQLRRYNTFRDSDSVDHAVLSHDIVRERGWLAAEGVDPALAEAILAAVLYHNRRALPDGLDALTAAAAHAVRDADKLDIFRVLEARVTTTDWRADSRVFWNLSVTAPPNPAVIAGIEAGASVDYQQIRSLADFVLIQVGWMVSGLTYPTARRLCADGGHLAFRRAFLHELTDDPAVDRVCDRAARELAVGRREDGV
jgi:HD superfamily phosphodiesterase